MIPHVITFLLNGKYGMIPCATTLLEMERAG